jgi:hypothetical protein
VGRAIEALEPSRRRVLEQARPGVLGLADDLGVRVLRGLLGEGGRVRPADHDRDTPAPERVGHLVGMQRRGRGRGDPDQVGRAVEVEALDDLVGVVDVVLARGQGRDQRHRELRELNQARPAQATRLRRLGGDQVNAHRPDRTR